MTPHLPALPAGPTSSVDGWAPTTVPALLRRGVHLLVAALLVLAVVRSLVGPAEGWPWVVAGAALVAVVYAVGPRWAAVGRSSRAAGAWLALLMVAWVALLALSPEAVYLAFPWFFLLLHLLPRPVGLAAVVLITAVAVAGFAWHQKTFTVAMVIGPVLGAGVVVATVFGYQSLHAESEHRRRLILELDRTRSELAAVEHRAGVMDERERLAREIHDTLAQGLSSIQLLLRAANRSLDPEREVDPARASGLGPRASSSRPAARHRRTSRRPGGSCGPWRPVTSRSRRSPRRSDGCVGRVRPAPASTSPSTRWDRPRRWPHRSRSRCCASPSRPSATPPSTRRRPAPMSR